LGSLEIIGICPGNFSSHKEKLYPRDLRFTKEKLWINLKIEFEFI
jgi:hypothetical protein